MANKIESMIEEIQEYIDGCDYVFMSNTHIKVNKEEIDDLLTQLRTKTPDEIRLYQKIISNKEAIMEDANKKANDLINQAAVYSNNLVNENEIMKQAYAQAQEVVAQATESAQQIIDQAMVDANNIRLSAMQYTDDSLAGLQKILSTAIETNQARHDSLMTNLQQYLQVVTANRAELHPEQEEEAVAERAEAEKMAQQAALAEEVAQQVDTVKP